MRINRVVLAAAAAAMFAVPASSASAEDFADTALNIIPSGQPGAFPPPPGASEQAEMYDGLTPLFDQVTSSDLTTYFKSERFGVDTDGPGTNEPVPRPGVKIVRDRFDVPHVTGESHDDGIWAAGWIAAEDRGLLLEQARFNARVAAIGAPGLSAIGLVTGLASFEPSEQTERLIAKQTKVLKGAGKEGRAVLHDIDVFVEGINDYYESVGSDVPEWTRNDIYALNALKGQFLGEGGGGEARRSQFLDGLMDQYGNRRAKSIFDDLRQFRNPELPTTVDGKFPYGRIPNKAPGSVIVDHGSFESTPAIADRQKARELTPPPQEASNTLMITAENSQTGNPLMVGGPQIGYFYPGLTYEIDMDAGDLKWRGATSVPFPGYLLIGRGEDFAVTLTSAGGDIVDQYAERLCGGSDEMYRYRGRCRSMKRFDGGTLDGEELSFLTTKHGPVVGYATVNGKKVAISRKRSSFGEDVLDQLFFRRLSNGQVDSPESFFRAANKTPQTFNSFYIDNEHVAMFTSGKLPVRPRGVDPGLLTKGNGKYEWEGFIGRNDHPQGIDPKDGTMTNWNQAPARGFSAADDDWARMSSVQRSELLDRNLKRLRRDGKWTLASVTGAMNAAATQDVRAIRTVPLLYKLLKDAPAPNQQAANMLAVLLDWRTGAGGTRLDRDLDGEIDHPGAAIMDEAWNRIANRLMRPRIGPQLDELASLIGRFSEPPGGQFSGWHQYFDRDVRALLGMNVKKPFENSYCGRGDLESCQEAIWNALARSGAALEKQQGSPNPADWRADATGERISFAPGLLPTTIRYTNRPSGIQQVISFNGHR